MINKQSPDTKLLDYLAEKTVLKRDKKRSLNDEILRRSELGQSYKFIAKDLRVSPYNMRLRCAEARRRRSRIIRPLNDCDSVNELDIGVRASTGLGCLQILTIGDLLRHRPENLLEVKNVGKQTLADIIRALKVSGFEWT